jgi:hypothetical protein
VRVWLQDRSHWYVLSRYLLCRALVGTKVAKEHAVVICLELKKSLVDLGIVDLSQEQFDGYLYRIMRVFGCVISMVP